MERPLCERLDFDLGTPVSHFPPGSGYNRVMRYIAFLRAINVGGRVVKMERLRELFTEMGCTKVETFIASGNVIFESREKNELALQERIETQLEKSLGYGVETFLRTDNELKGVAAHRAFSEKEIGGGTVYVAFLATKPSKAAVTALTSHRGEVDEFRIDGREVYWLCRKSFSESEFSKARLEKVLGTRATVRNSSTVRKIAAKYPAL